MADHFSNSRIYFHPACHQRILRSCLILIITSLFYFIPNLLFAQSDTEPAQIDREYIFELNDRISDLVEENKLDSARVLIGQALHYSNILGDLESEAYSMLSKARLFEDTGRPDSVLHILNDNLDRYENTEKETRLGNLLATANQRVGNTTVASRFIHKCLPWQKNKMIH